MKHRGIICLYILLFSLLVGWYASANSAVSAAQTKSDLRNVWELSQKVLEQSDKLIIKHSAPYQNYSTKADFDEMAIQLSEKLRFPVKQVDMHEEHPIYESTYTERDGVNVSLILLGTDKQEAYLIVKRETIGKETIIQAEAWEQKMKELLVSAGIKPNWNIVIQGLLTKKEGTSEEFLKFVQNETNAKEIERYDGFRTSSVTYNSPEIKSSVKSANRFVNLQAAVHQVTGTDEMRATIGIPLITIEY
ncbi:YwmB family TATA-box binding protein [Paenibacillus chondroitinus]|uniref:YwmB family TATA-box binding protein n=1 Tax=Paenibacillus chondroitinus TaxID=59842 RepID=A0ABU6DJ80_9BACL|nr:MULTISPECIES: YwmB family TATA-box binding protein [Paenibacillus]MCY9659482.1 YwmB family TATA-box binding protein [Paenibacillus anseongense]MEB4796877.1 YwmB family TATA-box binding protein [Paenibacillus chondroitinus]